MSSKYVGTWKLDSSENFDEYMKAVEVGFMMRKLGALAKPNVVISIDGDKWTIKSETSFTTSETTFELSKQFEDTTPDGRKVMTEFELEDGKLVQKQLGRIPSTITRELLDDDTLVAANNDIVVASLHAVEGGRPASGWI